MLRNPQEWRCRVHGRQHAIGCCHAPASIPSGATPLPYRTPVALVAPMPLAGAHQGAQRGVPATPPSSTLAHLMRRQHTSNEGQGPQTIPHPKTEAEPRNFVNADLDHTCQHLMHRTCACIRFGLTVAGSRVDRHYALCWRLACVSRFHMSRVDS